MIYLAVKNEEHEAVIIMAGVFALSILGWIYRAIARRAAQRRADVTRELRSTWETDYAKKLDYVRCFLVSAKWDEIHGSVTVTMDFFCPSPLPKLLVSNNLDQTCGGVSTVRLRMAVAGCVVFATEKQARTTLEIRPAASATNVEFQFNGELPKLSLTPDTRVAVGDFTVLVADHPSLACRGSVELIRNEASDAS